MVVLSIFLTLLLATLQMQTIQITRAEQTELQKNIASISEKTSFNSSWPAYRHDSQRTGCSEGPGPDTNNILWVTYVGAGRSRASPSIADNRVFITTELSFYCLNETDGSILWNGTYGSGGSSPTIDDGKVFVASGSQLYCLDEITGKSIWEFPVVNPVTPVIHDSRVLFWDGSDGGIVCCLNESTGKRIWTDICGAMAHTGISIVDDKVFFTGDAYAAVGCLNETDGHMIWDFSLVGCDINFAPLIADDRIYVDFYVNAEERDYICCLDANNGNRLWKYDAGNTSINCPPAISNGKIYLGLNSGLWCIDALSGNHIWHYTTPDWLGAPAIADDKVYACSVDDLIYCFDKNYGTLIWECKIEEHLGFSYPSIADGKLFVHSKIGGNLYCFGSPENPPVSMPHKELVENYFPHYIFDEQEKYYPTDFLYDDGNITNNPSNYNTSWPLTCYVHTAEFHCSVDDKNYLAIEYWLYCAKDTGKVVIPKTEWSDEIVINPHDHDWESVFCFFEKQDDGYVPRFISYFHHVEVWININTKSIELRDCYTTLDWQAPSWNLQKINETHPVVYIARWSHASYPKTFFDYAIHWTSIGIEPLGKVTKSIPIPIEPCDGGRELQYDDFKTIYVDSSDDLPQKFGDIDAPWKRQRWDDPGYLLYPKAIEFSGSITGLQEPKSKLYLHVYDNQSRHIGINHATNETELGIPDANYFDLGNVTFITLPENVTAFKVVVDSRYAENEVENYTIKIDTFKNDTISSDFTKEENISRGTPIEYTVRIDAEGKITVVPEFPSMTLLLLMLILVFFVAILGKRFQAKSKRT